MREVNYDERWKVARDLACKINLWPTVENLRHLDAALRRAKAEGIRMVETYARAFVHERAVQLDGFTGSSGMAGVIRGKQSEADRIVDWADARAAQIEEGE